MKSQFVLVRCGLQRGPVDRVKLELVEGEKATHFYVAFNYLFRTDLKSSAQYAVFQPRGTENKRTPQPRRAYQSSVRWTPHTGGPRGLMSTILTS